MQRRNLFSLGASLCLLYWPALSAPLPAEGEIDALTARKSWLDQENQALKGELEAQRLRLIELERLLEIKREKNRELDRQIEKEAAKHGQATE